MDLPTSFTTMLQEVAFVMTVPTFSTFCELMTGWVFARRRTLTGIMMAAGLVGERHHSVFYHVFAKARWSRDQLGLAVFGVVEHILPEGSIFLSLDDTLSHKRGRKVFGAGMHHDPLISSRGKKLVAWGHNWVTLAVVVRFPLWPDRPFSLPILFRLYLNEKTSAKLRRVHHTRPELAIELLKIICNYRKKRQFHLLADSTYGGQSVTRNLPDNCEVTSRLRMDAWLYDDPPAYTGKGRRRKKGNRLPAPREMLKNRARRLNLKIYGRKEKMRVVDYRARLRFLADRPVRVVAVEPLTKGRKAEAFFSTCVNATAVEILTWYSWRWSIEETFHDSKTHLGFEEPQSWSPKAVERTAPMAMLLYSVIVTWFAEHGHVHYEPLNRPWYTKKQHASFADMLATLRKLSIEKMRVELGASKAASTKILEVLENLVLLAA
jgi:SRSO17 transposase